MPQQQDEKRKLAEKKLCEDRRIDEESEQSFPASDPPSFMGGKHLVGAPRERETLRAPAGGIPAKTDK